MSVVVFFVFVKFVVQYGILFIVKLLIGGEFVELQLKEWCDIVNFVMQEVLVCVLFVMVGEVDVVICFVYVVFVMWKNMLVGVCMCIMLKFQVLICEYLLCIVCMLMVEQGKMLFDVEGDIFCGLEVVEYVCLVGLL